MTAHQEARNKAGLPLQQSKITCIPNAQGTEDPTMLLSCCGDGWSEVERHWATSTYHTCESRSRSWGPHASAWQYWRHNRSFLSSVIWLLLALYFISPLYYIMSRGILFLKDFYCIEIFWWVFFILTLFSIATTTSGLRTHMFSRKSASSFLSITEFFCWGKSFYLFTTFLPSPSKPLSASLVHATHPYTHQVVRVYFGRFHVPRPPLLSHSNRWKCGCTASPPAGQGSIHKHNDCGCLEKTSLL